MRWLDGLIDTADMSLSQLVERVEDREAWWAAVPGVTKSGTRQPNSRVCAVCKKGCSRARAVKGLWGALPGRRAGRTAESGCSRARLRATVEGSPAWVQSGTDGRELLAETDSSGSAGLRAVLSPLPAQGPQPLHFRLTIAFTD